MSHPTRPQPPSLRRGALWAVAAAALAATPVVPWMQPSAARAQLQGLIGEGPMVASDPDVKDPNTGVTVPDSLEAAKDLNTAHTMELQKDWTKAANWYQEVMSKYRAKVAPAAKDKNNVLRLYTSVTLQVRRQLAKWPAEGITAYRTRYETTAATLLEQAGRDDLGTLNQVFNSYFLTESAKLAGLRLIDAHIERGEFDRAAEFGDVLLQFYPAANLEVERPRVLYRTALAYHLCGNEPAAQDRLAQVKAKFPDSIGTIFGKEVNLAQNLEQQLQLPPTAAMGLLADSWPMPGGTPDRAAISQGGGRTGALEYSIDLSRTIFRGANKNALELEEANRQKLGVTLGVVPAVDRGELFFQDGQRIYALTLESGVPLAGWAQTYNSGNEHRGQYFLRANSSRAQQQTITVTESAVLAVMGPDRLAQMMAQGMIDPSGMSGGTDGTKLVCLDRETGKPKWPPVSLANETFNGEEHVENLKSLDFCGSPLVVGDNIFVLGRGGNSYEFENCYVLCFDLNTGKYKWSCFVASASTGNPYDGVAGMGGSAAVSHMAYSGGRLYVLSNLGALASIDAYTGTILWLAVYPRERSMLNQPNFNAWNGNRPFNPASNAKPWENNPVIASDGRLFVLPSDGKHLLIYDAGTGLEIKRIAVTSFPPPKGEAAGISLLAVNGEKLIVSGNRWATCFNWKSFDPNHRGNAAPEEPGRPLDGVVWASGSWDVGTRGRGFVTVDSVYIPTETCLFQLSMRNGKIEKRYPVAEPNSAPRPWDEAQKEGPGNVLVTSEHVIVASSRSVNVYTDMVMAQRKLDAEVAAAPGNPEPHLRYAEIMFAAGHLPVTFEKLGSAIELLGGADSMRPGATRDRLFNDTLAFAQKLTRDKSGESIDQAVQMYDLAGQGAYGDSQQVNYRMSRAKFARSVKDPKDPRVGTAAAVTLYQEILSNPDWRRVGMSQDDGGQGMAQAGAVAEQLIGEIVSHDKSAYAAIEQRATAALEAAKAAPEAQRPAKFLEVARTYPNSDMAPKSMLLAADAYEAAGDARLATHVLVGIYRKYSNRADNLRIVEATARNYLKLAAGGRNDGAGVALRRLEKAADRSPAAKLEKSLTLPDGSTFDNTRTVKDARDALAAWVKKNPVPAAPLPDFHISPQLTLEETDAGKHAAPAFLPAERVPVIADVTSIVVPPPELASMRRNDRVVVLLSGNDLAIYAPGEAKPIAKTKPLSDAARGLAWLRPAVAPKGDAKVAPNVFVVWTGHEIAAIRSDTGEMVWRSELRQLPGIEVVTAPAGETETAQADPEEAVDPNGARVIRARNGRLIVRGGRGVFVQQAMLAQQAQMNGLNGDAAGPPAVPPGEEQVWQLRPAGDRILAATSTGRLVCLGAADGKLLWQTRLASHPIDRLLANEDFAVVKVTADDNSVQLLTLDNYDGQIQNLKRFSADNGLVPVNLALSNDGLLAWTLPDRLQVRDLYEPGDAVMDSTGGKSLNPEDNIVNQNGQPAPIYAGMVGPNQLMFAGNKILTLENQGHFLTIHPLSDLQLTLTSKVAPPKPVPLQTKAQDPSAWLQVSGAWVYCIGTKTLMAYNINAPADKKWEGMMEQDTSNIREAFVGRDFVVLVDEFIRRHGRGVAAPIKKLHCFNREEFAAGESGLRVHAPVINDPAGIVQWQAVEGGFCYLSADHNLHTLLGARGK